MKEALKGKEGDKYKSVLELSEEYDLDGKEAQEIIRFVTDLEKEIEARIKDLQGMGFDLN